MTDSLERVVGLEAADIGLGLRPRNIGARIKRVEDRRLLTGQGVFTDDRIIPGALHVAFRRSDHAHALISSISIAAAASRHTPAAPAPSQLAAGMFRSAPPKIPFSPAG